MKPLLLKVNNKPVSSFDIRYEKSAYFNNPWHYHPELELTLITRSSGMRFIGDNIEPFEENDLVLLGSNLPHYWRNSPLFYEPNAPCQAEAIILRFSLDVWGSALLDTPEMSALKILFQQAQLGLHFPVETAEQIRPLLEEILAANNMERVIKWLQIFEILTKTEDIRVLSQKSFSGINPKDDSTRMEEVLAYVQEHLTEPIYLPLPILHT